MLADLIHIVYRKGAFGIFTPARSTRQAINAYLDGFLQEQNVRIRDKPITFQTHTDRLTQGTQPILEWGGLEKHLGDFHLRAGEGRIHQTEVVGVVGPNGTGKSTLIKISAGELEYDAGWVTAEAKKVSYKPQHPDSNMDCTVQEWLDAELGSRWRSGEFNVTVIRPSASTSCSREARGGPFREGNCRLRQSPYASVGMPICISSMNRAHIWMRMRGWRRRRRPGARWSARNDQPSSSITMSTSSTSSVIPCSSSKARAVTMGLPKDRIRSEMA